MMFKVSNITIPLESNLEIIDVISKKYHVNKKEINLYRIIKKSIDARDNNNIKFIYSAFVDIKNYQIKKYDKNIIESNDYELKYLNPEKIKSNKKVAVIGYGPCGIFASINLARAGLDVTIIERGKEVNERIKDVNQMFNNHILNTNSNI